MLAVFLGLSNGNAAVSAVDWAIESGKVTHTLLLDLGKTACEFAQQRVDKKIYSEWHAGRLEWDGLAPSKLKLQQAGAAGEKFDATPLVIRSGRLRIPEALVEEFLECEATSDLVEELLQDHAGRFHTGE